VGLTLSQYLQSEDPTLPPIRVHRQALEGKTGSYTSEWNGRLFHSHVEPLKDSSGALVGTIGLAVDVTERREMEEAFRLSEERFRLLCDHSPIAIGIGQRELVRYVNAAWLRLFGYGDAKEIVGTEVLQHIAPECHDDIKIKMRGRENGQAIPTSYDTIGLRKDGSRFIYQVDAARIPLHGGEATVVFGRDLTAERRVEEELRTSERQLRDAQKVAKIGSWEWNFLNDRVTWSRELYRIFGLDPEEYSPSLEGYLTTVYPEDRDRVTGLISEAREKAGSLDYECRILWPDGSVHILHVRGQVLSDPKNRGVRMVGVAADITERKEIEQALQAARADLETRVRERTAELARANEALRQEIEERKRAQEQLIRSEKLASMGMVVSGVAHEINNPLNVICGNLGLLTEPERLRALTGRARGKSSSRGLSAEGRKIRTMLRDAGRAAERARLIVETFRHFARDVRQAEWTDLNECIEEALAILRRQVPRAVKTVKRLEPLSPVKCFRAQIVQVFVNLIRNAYEAIEKKGTVTLKTGESRGMVVASVADTGRGLPKEIQDRLFEPFLTTKPPGKGLGVGLSISAAIVENHGGRIHVKSREGKGTEFQVELPIPLGESPTSAP
jgi:PAS domain S-box-containing protein